MPAGAARFGPGLERRFALWPAVQPERARDWEQRRAYDEWRLERFNDELLQRDEQKRKSGAYREPEYKGKPLNPKELRRYELIKPGERP